MIPAHDSPLAAMAFSLNGAEIATASEKGTVIRVFSVSHPVRPLWWWVESFNVKFIAKKKSAFQVNDGTKLYEFRRGVKRCVSISSLTFSTCKQYLCCSSNTETVHIFKLEKLGNLGSNDRLATHNSGAAGQRSSGGGDDGNWMGYFKNTVASYLPYALPTQVTDVFTQGRAFASAMLPVSGIKHACAITTIQKVLRWAFWTFDTHWIFTLTRMSFADFWSHHRTATCTSIQFPSTVVNVSWWRNMVSAPQASFVEHKEFLTRNCFSLFRILDLKNIDHATTQQDKTNQQQQQAQPTQPVPINAPSSNANSSKTSSSED